MPRGGVLLIEGVGVSCKIVPGRFAGRLLAWESAVGNVGKKEQTETVERANCSFRM